jgi:hypothetical protein
MERRCTSYFLWEGNQGMHDYSAYLIRLDGHIARRIDLLCADDADAYEQARQLVSDEVWVELWQRDHFLCTFVLRPTIH